MKTNNFFNLILASALFSLVISGCKKEESANNDITDNTEIAVAQDGESLDAIAESNDQSVDNIVDALEANDFSALKSTSVIAPVGGPTWVVDHKDTITFPKVITLTYNTDTTIDGERLKQNGQIIITLSLRQNLHPWRNYLKRKIEFVNFTSESDSAKVTILGTREMIRKSVIVTPRITSLADLKAATNMRLAVLDSIKAHLYFIIEVGDYKDTATREVSKTREAIVHFVKVVDTKIWRQVLLKDTLQFNGSVSGLNLRNESYSRIITTPVVFTRCAALVPVISSGVIAITNGTKTATITYSSDACKTTVILEKNGKTKEITRKTNRLFRRWW